MRCDSATQSQIGSPGSNDEPPLSPTVVSPSGSQSNPESEIVNDIGTVICANESIDKISATVNDLPAAKKYSLLFQHTQPPNELPKSFSHGCYRKFNPSWLEKYPWLRYSPRLDGVFHGPCALLLSNAKRKDKSKLVNAPFSNWVKLSDTLITHSSHVYHREALQSADILKSSIENPDSRVDVLLSSSLQLRIKENEHILRQIVQAILFLGKQGLAFRGDNESLAQQDNNPGNFLALLAMLAKNDAVLQKHLLMPRAKNATYISPRSQNEIINVIGYDVILSGIIEEVKNAKFYSIMADEVSSHNVEHLPLCVRFVDDSCQIREEFVSFLQLKRVRAVDLTEAIVGCLGRSWDCHLTTYGDKAMMVLAP